jgi:hypothetical protein
MNDKTFALAESLNAAVPVFLANTRRIHRHHLAVRAADSDNTFELSSTSSEAGLQGLDIANERFGSPLGNEVLGRLVIESREGIILEPENRLFNTARNIRGRTDDTYRFTEKALNALGIRRPTDRISMHMRLRRERLHIQSEHLGIALGRNRCRPGLRILEIK